MCYTGIKHGTRVLLHFSVLLDNLVEAFGLETPPPAAVTDSSTLLPFSQMPSSSSSSSSLTTPVLENSTQPGSSSCQAASTNSSTHTSPQSATFPSFLHTSLQTPEVPARAAPAATQHYTPAVPTAPASSIPVSVSTVASVSSPASAISTGAAAAVTHTVPLAGSASLAPTPTITIAPTQGLLQPSLVMSDQNLQWILSSAANAQHNPEQQGPKVEKVFFTTAIPVGGHSGNPVQQIGLSLPVIIIKQEEACQCQCACRDSAKERSSSQSAASSQQEPKDISPPPPAPPATHAVPECCSTKVSTPLSSGSTQTFHSEAMVSSTPSDSLTSVDVVDLLSPETTANIEALLMVADEFSMGEGNSNTTT
ncbi:hypothetical protein PDJAM_G00005240 [Pangasius djambal]|uniref:Uncharacterized protein n=1 Tax=Pangasius djambal TaxID=1691987 RepID=A0ACC5XYD6_9TELE|nr:hypothetical protein [Pangasius djambal]